MKNLLPSVIDSTNPILVIGNQLFKYPVNLIFAMIINKAPDDFIKDFD